MIPGNGKLEIGGVANSTYLINVMEIRQSLI